MSEKDIIGVINSFEWDSEGFTITINGYCYVKGKEQPSQMSAKKSLIIKNGNKKYYIPMQNVLSKSQVEEDGIDLSYCGFAGSVDLSFVDEMDSLSEGDWEVCLNLIGDDYDGTANLLCYKNIAECKPMIVKNRKHSVVKIEPLIKENNFIIRSSAETILKAEYNGNQDKNKQNNRTVKGLIKGLSGKINRAVYGFFKSLPLQENTVLFLSDSRADLNGNFEFVYDEIVRRGDFKIKTFLKPTVNSKFSAVDKLRFLHAVATSKFILLDDYYPKINGFNLREGIELVQLWHACGAFKTFGFSRLGKEGGPKFRSRTHRSYDKAIVSSESVRKHYAEGFGISEDKVFATGIPRTDVFFDEEYKERKIKEIKGKYPILNNKKIIMFAPTFRGNGQQTAYYDFDKFDIDKLYEKLGGEYVVIMKLHPFVKNVPKIDGKYSDFILDLTSEREINDLLFVSDILITDYSSVIYEFSLLNRPIIFFAYDMDEYIEKRDFYYPYRGFIPGAIATTTEQIIDIIESESFELSKLDSFRKRFFSHFDGKSTERVVDLLINNKQSNTK